MDSLHTYDVVSNNKSTRFYKYMGRYHYITSFLPCLSFELTNRNNSKYII